MTNECNLMEAEVKAMKLVVENTEIKVAKVYRYETSRKLCDGDYFFLECLEVKSWISVMDSLEENINSKIRMEVGKLQNSCNYEYEGTK